MRIVDETEHGTPVGDLREQAEAGGGDEKPLLGRSPLEAECTPQCGVLVRGKPLEVVEHRTQELMERGEGELVLRLDAARRENAHARGPVARGLEKGRLADPGLAAQHQRAAS